MLYNCHVLQSKWAGYITVASSGLPIYFVGNNIKVLYTETFSTSQCDLGIHLWSPIQVLSRQDHSSAAICCHLKSLFLKTVREKALFRNCVEHHNSLSLKQTCHCHKENFRKWTDLAGNVYETLLL